MRWLGLVVNMGFLKAGKSRCINPIPWFPTTNPHPLVNEESRLLMNRDASGFTRLNRAESYRKNQIPIIDRVSFQSNDGFHAINHAWTLSSFPNNRTKTVPSIDSIKATSEWPI